MTPHDYIWLLMLNGMALAASFTIIYYGWPWARWFVAHQESRYQQVLNNQLLMDISPRLAVVLSGLGVLILGGFSYVIFQNVLAFLAGALLALALPTLVVNHLEAKRRKTLEGQLVDAITTLASGVRAGLTLVQSMELLTKHHHGPVQQEFDQLLREYNLGVDLNQAMHNTSNRIALSNYRLLFSAIEAHRQRGGDVGQSLDRIADSIREIQRLEGRLTALTAQGRTQARMMGAMPIVVIGIFYMIDPQDTSHLLTEPLGRLILLLATAMILAGFFWIRKIMAVDI